MRKYLFIVVNKSIKANRHYIVIDINEPAINIHRVAFAVTHIFECSGIQTRDYRGMVIEHREPSFRARKRHQLNLAFENNFFCRYNLKRHNFISVNALTNFGKQFLALFDGFVDSTNIEECLFGILVHFAIENHIEAADGFAKRHHHTGQTGELFGHKERLRQETLCTACTSHYKFVIVAEFIDTENGNDILKLVILLQQLLNSLGSVIVVFADDMRVENTRCLFKRVDGWIYTELGNLTAKHCGGIEEVECSCRGRVGQVVGRHIDGLD